MIVYTPPEGKAMDLQYDPFKHLYTSLLANLKNLSITCPKGCLAGDSVALE